MSRLALSILWLALCAACALGSRRSGQARRAGDLRRYRAGDVRGCPHQGQGAERGHPSVRRRTQRRDTAGTMVTASGAEHPAGPASDLLIDDLTWMTKQWAKGGEARKQLLGACASTAGSRRCSIRLGSMSYGELAGQRMKLGLLLRRPGGGARLLLRQHPTTRTTTSTPACAPCTSRNTRASTGARRNSRAATSRGWWLRSRPS